MNFGKVLIFNGSPRKNGHTSKLLGELSNSAQKAGAEVKEYNLSHPGVKGCQSCFYCRTHEGCSILDPLQSMYEEIKTASGIVFGSPIYFYQITGQAKQGLDRMYPMLNMQGAKPTPRYPGKKVVTIFAQANPNKETSSACVQNINTIFTLFGWTVLDSIICAGAVQNDLSDKQDLLEQARTLGVALSK